MVVFLSFNGDNLMLIYAYELCKLYYLFYHRKFVMILQVGSVSRVFGHNLVTIC